MTDDGSAQVFPIFVINLDRRPDRLRRMAAQLDALDLEWERIPAIDAKTATDADLAPDVDVAGMRFSVARGAMCLAATNVRLMRRIVRDKLPGAIILQDDVTLSPDIALVARRHDWAPERFGLVQMEHWHRTDKKLVGPGEPTALPGRRIHRLHSKALGAACFFLRDHGARTFLDRGLPIRASGDHSLFNPVFAPAFDAMRTAILNPALAQQHREETGSDITGAVIKPPPNRLNRKRLRGKIRKEVPSAARWPKEAWLRLTGRARRVTLYFDPDARA